MRACDQLQNELRDVHDVSRSSPVREFWKNREVAYFLAWRDIKVRYKQALLGAAWAILQPLLATVVFTLVFSRVAGVSSDGIPYPVFAYSALLLWTYFSGVIGQAGQSLVSNSNLITKVYFPRIALPASSALSGLLDFAVGSAFLAVLMSWYGARPGWLLVLAPLFVLALILLTVGTSLFLAALNVSYRDVKYALPTLIQLWLFLTPVIYPMSAIPERLQPLMALNPMSGIVEGFRSCLFAERPLDLELTLISLTTTVLVFVAGVVYFSKSERGFADVI